ncbi:MAG: cysteine desulfurase family protein [Pseudomonadota bacterium]
MDARTSVYCDYNATAPLRDSARQAMLGAMAVDGNPSSIHANGRSARRTIEDARKTILMGLGAEDYRLVFTSGATEALSMVLRPTTRRVRDTSDMAPPYGRNSRLFVATTEHVAALDGHGFESPTKLAVDQSGVVDLAALYEHLGAMAEDDALVCVHGANNETGVVQPIADIARRCREAGALFVSDLVQWIGREPIPDPLPDVMIISAHKLGGPAGVGALVYNPATVEFGPALIRGGGQEMGARAGTENRVGIAGFAAAVTEALGEQEAEANRVRGIRDSFELALKEAFPSAIVFGDGAHRLPNTSCFALEGTQASTTLMRLDLEGIALSSGSACSSGKVKASHVLAAMGADDLLANCALRLSLGYGTTESDIRRVIEALRR